MNKVDSVTNRVYSEERYDRSGERNEGGRGGYSLLPV